MVQPRDFADRPVLAEGQHVVTIYVKTEPELPHARTAARMRAEQQMGTSDITLVEETIAPVAEGSRLAPGTLKLRTVWRKKAH